MKLDAPFYSEVELDELERTQPREALRIAREQAILKRQLAAAVPEGAAVPAPQDVRPVLEEARAILLRDGGDLAFERLEGDILYVRLKGACAGCPRAALDLKNVVEALVRRHFPAIREVKNIY